MSNDVVIRVRVRQDARDGFAAVSKEAEAEGQRSGEKYVSRFGTVMARMGTLLQEHTRRAGTAMGTQMGDQGGQSFVQRIGAVISNSTSKLQEIGRNIGKRVGSTITTEITDSVVKGVRDANGRLRDEKGRFIGGAPSGGIPGRDGDRSRGGKGGDANVDIDKPSLLSRFLNWGKESAESFWSGFSDKVSNFFNGDVLSTIIKGSALALLGTALSAPIAAAITTAVGLGIGSAGIAAGVVAAFKDPRIASAATELKGKLAKAFEKFGEPFRGPVAQFLEKFTRDFLPQLERFGASAGKVLAPLTGKLGDGIIGMLQNLLPGLLQGLENAAPIIETLAKRLPDIGQAMGDFFRVITQNSDDASVFFNDLITVVIKIINTVARLVNAFTSAYGFIRGLVLATVAVLQNIWKGITDGTASAKRSFLTFANYGINLFGRMLEAAATAFSWIPGLGGKLRGAQAAFGRFRASVNGELNKIPKEKTVTIRGYNAVGRAVANALSDLAKVASSYATGGIVGQFPQQLSQAASGGIRNGLTLVGERGPEILDLAPGSRVWSNEDSRRMASNAGGGDGGWMEARWVGSESMVVNEIMQGIQLRVRRQFSGSVQSAMGA